MLSLRRLASASSSTNVFSHLQRSFSCPSFLSSSWCDSTLLRSSFHSSCVPLSSSTFPTQTVATKITAASHPSIPPLPPSSVPSSWSASALENHGQYADVASWVSAYRRKGFLLAELDPLGFQSPAALGVSIPELSPSLYGLDAANDPTQYPTAGLIHFPDGRASATLKQMEDHLKSTYCGTVGVQTAHLLSWEESEWIAQKMESIQREKLLSPAEKRNIFIRMLQSEVFDHFMTVKFGQFKRYGLEGAESMQCFVESLFLSASSSGVTNIVLGMPHRGRFNLLVGLLDYPARALFAKVKGLPLVPGSMTGDCDVASHIGHSVTKKFDGKNTLAVSLLHNPSHLEAVNPVAMGKARSKQDLLQWDQHLSQEEATRRSMCVMLHGDAAFAGQGVNQESLAMANLSGFYVGGAVHLVVNNQLGFTTDGSRGRSTPFSADLGKMILAPIIQVNAEDPEAVVAVARLSMEYRQRFAKDILVDLIGYRKYGHNEVDEPAFTQPRMYENIRKRKSVVTQYAAKLKSEGLLEEDGMLKMVQRLNQHLEKELQAATGYTAPTSDHFQGLWASMQQPRNCLDVVDSGVDGATLRSIGLASVRLPEGFTVHQRLDRAHVKDREQRVEKGEELDWATCEAMAWGSLMKEGFNVRIVGQDVERGTFSQRHTVLVDQTTERKLTPLNECGLAGKLTNVNSHLSELAVMGFEFGYSWDSPRTLNLWEAQFGDFFNGAQVVIDTFLSSSETKWLRQSGLTLLLPHGFDGAGPEHSSCRMERFLQLVDSDAFTADLSESPKYAPNLLVTNPSTPAQYFHLLRRQMLRKYRRPMVVVGPKTLLRHTAAVSSLNELTSGSFRSVLEDPQVKGKEDNVRTVMLVSGKIYYDIDQLRKGERRGELAVIRLEELSPFPFLRLSEVLRSFSGAKQILWVQEEPQNSGALMYVLPRIQALLKHMKWPNDVKVICRPPIASIAVGSGIAHKAQVEALNKEIVSA